MRQTGKKVITSSKKLSKLIMRILSEHPYYGEFACEARYYTETKMPQNSAAYFHFAPDLTPVVTIREDMWNKCSTSALSQVITHEVLHPLLKHDPVPDQLMLIAYDLAIIDNLLKMDDFEKETGYQVCKHTTLGPKLGITLPSMASHMEYYSLLRQAGMQADRKQEGDEGQGQAGGQAGGQAQGEGPGEGEVVVVTDKGGNKVGEYYVPKPGKKLTTAQKYKIAEIVQKGLRQAGTVPGHLQSILQEWLGMSSEVPWQAVLSQFVSNSIRSHKTYTWSRRSRRNPWLQPGGKQQYKCDAVTLLDVSGSMSDRAYNESLAEHKGITGKAKVTAIQFDTEVKCIHEVEKEADLKKLSKREGYGGTDFRPAIHKAMEYRPNCIIVFTDAEGPWPDSPPPCPLLVVYFGSDKKRVPPYGKVVYAKGDY